jgi:hypothetical protein
MQIFQKARSLKFISRAWKAYRKALYLHRIAGLAVRDKIVVQRILGGDEFIEWIR